MKKIILLLVLVLNLIPCLKNGTLQVGIDKVYAMGEEDSNGEDNGDGENNGLNSLGADGLKNNEWIAMSDPSGQGVDNFLNNMPVGSEISKDFYDRFIAGTSLANSFGEYDHYNVTQSGDNTTEIFKYAEIILEAPISITSNNNNDQWSSNDGYIDDWTNIADIYDYYTPPPLPWRICSSTFSNFKVGNDNSFFNLNVMGLRIVGSCPDDINQFNSSFNLSNGISDDAMNRTIPLPNIMDKSSSPLGFLFAYFRDAIPDGDLRQVKESDGKYYWYFSQYLAAKISQMCSDLAAVGTLSTFGQAAATPNNSAAATEWANYATSLIKSFMPGSTVNNTPNPRYPSSVASYLPGCK